MGYGNGRKVALSENKNWKSLTWKHHIFSL